MTRLSDHVHHLGVESELVSKVLHHVLHRGVALTYVLLGLSVRIAMGTNRPGVAEIKVIVLSMKEYPLSQ